MVFSKTVEELLDNLKDIDHKIFWSHGRPIPDCFEIPTREALKDPSFTHLLIVEEDMIIPSGAIKRMLKKNVHAVAYDYPVTGKPSGTVMYDTKDTAFFTGTGLLLLKMDIVRLMPFPIWRVDIAWNMVHRPGYMEFTVQPRQKADYGQQDIAMGLRLYINKMPIYVMQQTTGQRKLIKRGSDMTNDGTHDIFESTEVIKYYTNLQDVQDNGFKKVKFPDGKIIDLWHVDAERLVGEGKAEEVTILRGEFNNLDVIKDWVKLKEL